MNCPNCGKSFKDVTFDNQAILHCENCGCSFFEQNGINRISPKSARDLAADKKTTFIKGEGLACPKDSSIMIPVQNEEAIPLDVTLLRCPSCYGVFAHPEDLLRFKKAQNVKIKFFKIWGKPLPSLQAVLVFGFIAFIIGAMALSIGGLDKKSLVTTSADEQIRKVFVQKADNAILFSFVTVSPYRSKVIFTDRNTGLVLAKDVLTKPDTLHVLTVKDIDITHDIYYRIILIDPKGQEIVTKEVRLQL